ncbi:DNA mismatch endonuclease, patch repair protein [Paenibacillus catalpae]|uniref:Very short patch repair endonuclease n=1 Tax=Paenibacillus catalpae TaxID=1045775 RepID=A0A1I2E2V0_9BACL|nr:very short patch repair endonuclease [Paenibacillus catalpae]SFE86963.1 DNA mismatch endonuclease, patch repair protein [Paenibacillus catalpae]
MSDNLSSEHRKKNMRAIRSVSRLETRVSKKLWACGIRFRRNVASLFGKPDFAIKKYKIVIFIDSCFWHSCNQHANIPKTNSEYWIAKLERNRKRDIQVTEYYRSKDWNILRIWEHDLKKESFDRTINKIINFIEDIKCVKSQQSTQNTI